MGSEMSHGPSIAFPEKGGAQFLQKQNITNRRTKKENEKIYWLNTECLNVLCSRRGIIQFNFTPYY